MPGSLLPIATETREESEDTQVTSRGMASPWPGELQAVMGGEHAVGMRVHVLLTSAQQAAFMHVLTAISWDVGRLVGREHVGALAPFLVEEVHRKRDVFIDMLAVIAESHEGGRQLRKKLHGNGWDGEQLLSMG